MKFHIIYFIFILLAFSCKTNGQKVDNKKPMYGEVTKSDQHKVLDDKFIQECLKKYGSIDSSVLFHIDYAWKYYYNNSLETAMKRFNQAWMLNPEFPDAYFGFASLLEEQGNKKEAQRFYKIGEEKDTGKTRSEICYQRIADCTEQLKNMEGAISAYSNIIKINPQNAFAHKKSGYFYMTIGNNNEAIKAYDEAIKLDPQDEMTYNNRAYLYQTIKQFKLAIKDYTKAIELNPNYISALVNRGITEMELNQFDKAKVDFEKCVNLNANAGELWQFLGIAKLNLGDKSGACKDFERALELGDIGVSELIKMNCEK